VLYGAINLPDQNCSRTESVSSQLFDNGQVKGIQVIREHTSCVYDFWKMENYYHEIRIRLYPALAALVLIVFPSKPVSA
jgi:hypothetical protein